MVPVMQEYVEDPQRQHAGDCFRACLASILEQSLDVVPHFFEGARQGTRMTPAMEIQLQDWFSEKGLALLFIPILTREPEQAMAIFGGRYPTLYYVLVGQTRKGVHHAIVCRGTEIAHDPSKTRMGLYGPQDDGFFTICVIAFSQPL